MKFENDYADLAVGHWRRPTQREIEELMIPHQSTPPTAAEGVRALDCSLKYRYQFVAAKEGEDNMNVRKLYTRSQYLLAPHTELKGELINPKPVLDYTGAKSLSRDSSEFLDFSP
ncbi:hypothetical protein MMC12_007225 [Toensbergia leucococca]|nr:hypothetical protein [Toensbergia leucococca]